MPVEMRLEAAAGAVPAPGSPRESPQRDADGAASAALRDLIAARLVTHEAIGDPARLGSEAAGLRALCGLVAGPVYRLEPFHYAFAARDADLHGAPAGPGEREAALDAALAAALGQGALWLGALEAPLAGEPAGTGRDGPPAAMPAAALLVLRAEGAAVAEGLAAAGPGLRAVIDARFAAEAARRAADFAAAVGLGIATEAGAVAAAALETRLAALEARLAEREAGDLRARETEARAARAFEARLGLALAEFLARLERRDGAAAPLG